jgi:hypothetical protein
VACFIGSLSPLVHQYTQFGTLWSNITAYLLIAVGIHLIYMWFKQMLATKLVEKDPFGRSEFYLGMMAGVVRFGCILLVALSLMNSYVETAAELAQTEKFQKDNFSDIRFPTYGEFQQDVLFKSFTGNLVESISNPFLLLRLPPPKRKKKTPWRRRRIRRSTIFSAPAKNKTPSSYGRLLYSRHARTNPGGERYCRCHRRLYSAKTQRGQFRRPLPVPPGEDAQLQRQRAQADFSLLRLPQGRGCFAFVKEYENIDFPDAVRRLAERARIPIETENQPGGSDTRHLKDRLLQIHEQITQRWQAALAAGEAGQMARDYLARRGVSAEAVQLFRLGCAPEAWDDTVNWAKSKHYEMPLMEQAGLILRKEGIRPFLRPLPGTADFPDLRRARARGGLSADAF